MVYYPGLTLLMNTYNWYIKGHEMTDTTLRYPIRQDVARSQSALQADLQSLVPSLDAAGGHTGHHRVTGDPPWGYKKNDVESLWFPVRTRKNGNKWRVIPWLCGCFCRLLAKHMGIDLQKTHCFWYGQVT